MNVADPLASLRSRFIARCADDQASLRAHLDGRPLDPQALRFTIHRLAGAAGTFGHAEVGQAAGQAEDAILEHPNQTDASLRKLVEALSKLIEDGA